VTEDLTAYVSVKRWISNFPDRPNTRRSYLIWLSKFSLWIGKDPDVLIADAKSDSSETHDLLKTFYNYLLEKGFSSNTAVLAYQALRSFYRWNEINLGRTPRGFKGRVEYASSYVLSQEDVAKIVYSCESLRDKALIAFLAQSGQRCGVITALRLKHVRRGIERKEYPLIIDIPPILRNNKGVNVNKLGDTYRFAIGKDAITLLIEMLKERKNIGEPLDDESWLFRSYAIVREENRKPVRASKTERGQPLTTAAIREIVHRAAKKVKRQISAMKFILIPLGVIGI
jgi:integrase